MIRPRESVYDPAMKKSGSKGKPKKKAAAKRGKPGEVRELYGLGGGAGAIAGGEALREAGKDLYGWLKTGARKALDSVRAIGKKKPKAKAKAKAKAKKKATKKPTKKPATKKR